MSSPSTATASTATARRAAGTSRWFRNLWFHVQLPQEYVSPMPSQGVGVGPQYFVLGRQKRFAGHVD